MMLTAWSMDPPSRVLSAPRVRSLTQRTLAPG